jgi:8-oxo-dGTP diphosphatase
MNDRNVAVTLECFIRKGGKYLMLHRNPTKRILPDVWMAPGGHVEFAEGLFACARREVLEETGLTIRNLRVKVVGAAYLKDLHEEFFFHLLVADYTGGELITHDKDGEFLWLAPEDILALPTLLAELKHVLPHIFSDNKDVLSYRAVYDKGNIMTEFAIEEM